MKNSTKANWISKGCGLTLALLYELDTTPYADFADFVDARLHCMAKHNPSEDGLYKYNEPSMHLSTRLTEEQEHAVAEYVGNYGFEFRYVGNYTDIDNGATVHIYVLARKKVNKPELPDEDTIKAWAKTFEASGIDEKEAEYILNQICIYFSNHNGKPYPFVMNHLSREQHLTVLSCISKNGLSLKRSYPCQGEFGKDLGIYYLEVAA